MERRDRTRALLHRIRLFPLSWLRFSQGNRLLCVALSYGLGIAGLWFLFPLTHNGSTMFLPIASACWLFRYRGLFISLILNGIAFQLTYLFLLRGLLPDAAFIEGGIIGFGTSLGIGLIVCWLRTAVDSVQQARWRAMTAEQERWLTEFRERQAVIAYKQQCQINTLKDQFLLNVNHELRSPLTALAGYMELLAMQHEHLDPTMQARMLKGAQASLKELAALIDQMLEATRVVDDIPVAKPEAVNVQHVLQQVLAALAPGERAAYVIRLQASEQIMVWADPQLLRQVLRNLLTNIFKYVPKQTEIRIEATQADLSCPVSLSVQDEGPGIPAEEQPLLFERFVRLKRDLAGSIGGTGLGLYLCKQYIEAMGGRIWVESPGHEGLGSRFCLTLPPVPPAVP